MMNGCGMFGWGGFGGLGIVGAVLNLVVVLGLIAGITALVIWAVRRFAAGGSAAVGTLGQTAAPSAREILQVRYVRGELTREQYLEMVVDLA